MKKVSGQTRRGNPKAYKITQGLSVDSIDRRNEVKRYSKAGNVSDDSENRLYVQKKILKHIGAGLSEEEALDKIMKDDIVNKFEYLTKNGLNIRECFRNWAREYAKGHENKDNDCTR